MEMINKKEENMKQETNLSNTEEYEIIEEKKPVKDIKKQSTNDQQLPEVTITKQNDTNITTAPKEKATTREPNNRQKIGCNKMRTIKE